MNLKRCNNGHFYDADQYTICPHCNPTISASKVTIPITQNRITRTGGGNKTADFQKTVSAIGENDLPTEDLKHTPPAVNPERTISLYEDARTVSYYTDSIGAEPVVGWLVCIKGEHYGESFALKSGRNFIGRNSNQDVSLTGDMSISRERHAIIIYEPKTKCFIAQAGNARELFYLNDTVVLSNMKLNSYDVLSIGNANLLFLALCGQQFCWENTRKTE